MVLFNLKRTVTGVALLVGLIEKWIDEGMYQFNYLSNKIETPIIIMFSTLLFHLCFLKLKRVNLYKHNKMCFFKELFADWSHFT